MNNLTEEVQVFWSKDSSDGAPPKLLTTLPGNSTHPLPLESTGFSSEGFHLTTVYAGYVVLLKSFRVSPLVCIYISYICVCLQ